MTGMPTPPPSAGLPTPLFKRLEEQRKSAAAQQGSPTLEAAASPQGVQAESPPATAATTGATPAAAGSPSPAPPAEQAVPYSRFTEVNEERKRLAAEAAELRAKLARKDQEGADLIERLRKGEVDETTIGPAVEALVNAQTADLRVREEERELRQQLGTMPKEAQDAVIEMFRTVKPTGLSLEDAAEIVRKRQPSLFPATAGFNPSNAPPAPGGRVAAIPPLPNGERNWRAEMAAAQGAKAKQALAFEWMRSQKKASKA